MANNSIVTSTNTKLETSESIYNRIKWQSDINSRDCCLAYIDRHRDELVKIPFHEWIPLSQGGDIPWHRVQQIIYRDQILWDRVNRIYREELLVTETNLSSNTKLIEYDVKQKIWNPISKQNPTHTAFPDMFSVVTWNCLFDIYPTNPPLPNVLTRLSYIIDEITIEELPNIICLQEITEKMKKHLLTLPVIRDSYLTLNHIPLPAKRYTQMTFILKSNPPVSQSVHRFSGNTIKTFVQTTFKCDNCYLDVYNVHLTSDMTNDASSKRNKQLEEIRHLMNPNNFNMVVGDFNTDLMITQLPDMIDSWTQVHPNASDVDSFTYDSVNNPLASLNSNTKTLARFDRVLASNLYPIDIKRIGTTARNDIYLSDHYGLMSLFSTFELAIHKQKKVEPEPLVSQTVSKVSFAPGTALDLILPVHQWKRINTYRDLYDHRVESWAPHITLLHSFIPLSDLSQWDNRIEKIMNDFVKQVDVIPFDKVSRFHTQQKYFVVLTSSHSDVIKTLHSQLENLFDIKNLFYEPHITLGSFKSIAESDVVVKKATHDFQKNPLMVSMDHLDFLVTRGDIAQVQKTYPASYSFPDNMTVQSMLTCYLDLVLPDYKFQVVGSRAFGNDTGDRDLIIISTVSKDIVYKRLEQLFNMSSYVIYAKHIKSQVETLNVIFKDGSEYDLIYLEHTNSSNIPVKVNPNITSEEHIIHQKHVLTMIEATKTLHSYIRKNSASFMIYFDMIKKWFQNRKIYNYKYGYFNGYALLIMTIKVFQYLKYEAVGNYKFLLSFLEYYSDWNPNKPISLEEVTGFQKKFPSDHVFIILSVTKPYNNILRRIMRPTVKIIMNEIKNTYVMVKNLPTEYAKQELKLGRQIQKPYVLLTVSEISTKQTIEKTKYITSEIWRVFLQLKSPNPDTD